MARISRVKQALGCGGALLLAASVPAQDVPAPAAGRVRASAADYPAPAAFPNENAAAVAEHLSKARKLAGNDLFPDFAHRCILSPVYGVRVRGIQFDGKIIPTRVFDNLYSVGQNAVSAYALVTSAGIILFDALDNEDEARNLIVPNLRTLGLDPKAIKYVVVTHGHGDHYGGARYLQDTYGARVIASENDWGMMDKAFANGPFKGLVPPRRDMVMGDGQTLALGDTVVRFYITPGHTPGTLSAIFQVKDRGTPHVVGFHGGTGGGRDLEGLRSSIPGFERWGKLTAAAKVDTLIANHPLHAESIEKEEIVRHLQPGDSNPFVIGREAYQRYIAIQAECARVQLARMGVSE